MRQQALHGVKWTTLSAVVTAATAVLRLSILARFVDKADFGLVALATFVIGFMELFNDIGLSTAIIHKQNITKREYASLYWFNVLVSMVLYGVALVLTPSIAAFYNQPALRTIIPLLGMSLILSGLGRQFKTIDNKNLYFKRVSIVEIIASIVSLVVGVYFAITGLGVMALVYSTLAQVIISNGLFLIGGIRSYGLLLHLSFAETKPFLKIGGYQVGGQVINYFNRDLDILLIGKLFSPEILGGYSLAKQLVFRPTQLINPILTKVASPILALMQSNLQQLQQGYLRLVNVVASVNIPMYAVLAIGAPIIVPILYGEQFTSIVVLVQILSVYMIFRAIGNPIGSLVVATGRTDVEFWWNVSTLLLMPAAIYIGAQFGIVGVATSLTITMALLFVPSWKLLVYRLTQIPLREYILAIVRIRFKI